MLGIFCTLCFLLQETLSVCKQEVSFLKQNLALSGMFKQIQGHHNLPTSAMISLCPLRFRMIPVRSNLPHTKQPRRTKANTHTQVRSLSHFSVSTKQEPNSNSHLSWGDTAKKGLRGTFQAFCLGAWCNSWDFMHNLGWLQATGSFQASMQIWGPSVGNLSACRAHVKHQAV